MLIVAPPTMVFLSKSPLVDQYDLSSVKVIRCGSAPLGRELRSAVQTRLNISTVQQSYGMTECVSISGQTIGNEKTGSVGVLRPGIFGRVICLDSGKSNNYQPEPPPDHHIKNNCSRKKLKIK